MEKIESILNTTNELTYFQEVDALADMAISIMDKWQPIEGGCGSLETPVGSILKVSQSILVFPNDRTSHDTPVSEMEYRGEYSLGKKNPSRWVLVNEYERSYNGKNLDLARVYLIAITQYLASEDFQKNRADAIAQMERITRAIKGE